jgi:transposase
MARRGYPSEFRKRVLELVASGRKVVDVARDLGVTEQTIYNWRRQDRIDRGDEAGLTTGERAELLAVKHRIRELETELEIHRRSTELLKGSTDPKGGGQRSR